MAAMLVRPTTRAVLTILVVASLAAACQAVGSPAPSSTPIGSPGSAGPVGPAATPTETAGATPSAVASPSTEPPAASLAAEGGDPVAGQLGSYTWLSGGSDSPWLPGAPINVGAREPLTVTIGDGVAVVDWSARQAAAGSITGTGAVSLGRGGPPVAFAAPGPGAWSVQVTVRFADDLGSASYYWQIAVH
jgi:hypothetical protein